MSQACTDSGFFYVINHGISQEFMEKVFFQSKRFFALPIDEKMKLLRTEKYRGYTPILDEILDPDKQINGWLNKHTVSLVKLLLVCSGKCICRN